MTAELFESRAEPLGPGALWLRGLACAQERDLLAGVREVTAQAPLRHMVTPGGFRMSVAMSNCGTLGWVADRSGYRYDANDPADCAVGSRRRPFKGIYRGRVQCSQQLCRCERRR